MLCSGLSHHELRRQLGGAILLLAAATSAGGSPGKACAQAPRLTYQAPSDFATYDVPGGPPGDIEAYQYCVPSGSETWSGECTVTWRYVDRNDNPNPAPGFWPDDGDGRLGHRFYLDQFSWPWWDPDGTPRVEFVSATGPVQNAELPDPRGWDGAGVITPGMEQTFIWSLYLDTFATGQQWADLLQFHPGGNYDYVEGWPDTNSWVGLVVNGATLKLTTHAHPPEDPLWADDLSNYLGRWVDFALFAYWSTGSDGRLQFYVGGQLVAEETGNNFYQSTNDQPFLFVRQGYYRARNITSQDALYQTPVLVTMPLP